MIAQFTLKLDPKWNETTTKRKQNVTYGQTDGRTEVVKLLPLSLSTIWWNHLYLSLSTIPSISKSTQHTSMTQCMYPESFEKIQQYVFQLQCENKRDGQTDEWTEVVKPLPLSLSTIWWNHIHCFCRLYSETKTKWKQNMTDGRTPTVSNYYLMKPIPLSLSSRQYFILSIFKKKIQFIPSMTKLYSTPHDIVHVPTKFRETFWQKTSNKTS